MDRSDDPQETSQLARMIASECLGARVRILNRRISRIYDEVIRSHGIKFSQMNILTLVTLYGSVPSAKIGRMLSLEKSTLSRNVGLMESKGWIRSSPGDGNSRVLSVTRQGRDLLRKAAPDWSRAQEKAASMLGESAAEEIRRAANRIGERERGE